MELKGTEHFKQYGFARKGDYNNWKERVEKLQGDTILNDRGFLFGDLLVLAIYYVDDGQENAVTKSFHEKFHGALNPVIETPEDQ